MACFNDMLKLYELKEFPFHLQSIVNICATEISKITRFCNDLQFVQAKKKIFFRALALAKLLATALWFICSALSDSMLSTARPSSVLGSFGFSSNSLLTLTC